MSFVDRLRAFTGTTASDPTVQVLRGAAADAQRSRLPQMAAALSYRTIFGLIPVLAIGLWILHGMVEKEKIAGFIDKIAGLVGLKGIAVDSFVGPVPEGTTPAPEPSSLDPWINSIVAQVDKISFEAIGMIGIVMLLYAGIAMVVEVERAFNQIYRVPRGRSWTRRLVIYWALLTLGPICLFTTFYLQQQLPTIAQKWTYTGSEFLTAVLLTVGQATQYLISTALLLIVYQVVPNTKVKFWPALWGALIAALVFEAGKYGFGQYVAFSARTSYARLYGSLALLPLFLLWVYVTWLIVLFGLQITYQLQHGRLKTRAQPIIEMSATLVEPSAGLMVMAAIARAFGEGRPLDAPALATRTRLADPVVRMVLARLVERNLLHRIEAAGGTPELSEPGYTLARSPDNIRIAELLELGFELAGGVVGDPVIDRMRSAQIQAAGHETLAQALTESAQGAATGPRTEPSLIPIRT